MEEVNDDADDEVVGAFGGLTVVFTSFIAEAVVTFVECCLVDGSGGLERGNREAGIAKPFADVVTDAVDGG